MATTSCQGEVEIEKPPSFQAKHPKFPQLLLIRLGLLMGYHSPTFPLFLFPKKNSLQIARKASLKGEVEAQTCSNHYNPLLLGMETERKWKGNGKERKWKGKEMERTEIFSQFWLSSHNTELPHQPRSGGAVLFDSC